MQKQNTPSRRPFFARFLESQELSQARGGKAVTLKYPSDTDEDVTLKYPSDSDEYPTS